MRATSVMSVHADKLLFVHFGDVRYSFGDGCVVEFFGQLLNTFLHVVSGDAVFGVCGGEDVPYSWIWRLL